MGLSSKQVSSDGLDWAQNLLLQNGGVEVPKPSQSRQQPQQQQPSSPPLRCPRCDSSNTKFCYYNNYNQSQPRHFCKACRRHWTKGGTLRNVPVGGGRKNKRLKTGKTEQRSSSSSSATDTNTAVLHQQHQQLPFEFPDKKNISDILYRALLQPPPSLPLNANYINESSTTTTTNSASTSTSSNNSNGSFVPSLRPLPPIPQFSSFTTMDSLIDNPCSTSFMESTQLYSNFASSAAAEDFLFDNSKETQLPPLNSQSWQIPTSSGFLDSSHWNWDDFSFFLSPDPKPPQDDCQHHLQGI